MNKIIFKWILKKTRHPFNHPSIMFSTKNIMSVKLTKKIYDIF